MTFLQNYPVQLSLATSFTTSSEKCLSNFNKKFQNTAKILIISNTSLKQNFLKLTYLFFQRLENRFIMPGAVINTNAMKGHHGGTGHFQDKEKPAMIRQSNMQAAKAVADAVRSSLGPNGMDKIIQDEKGDVEVTNDGATILKKMCVLHPAARMLVDLSMAQDIEAGDGTTSVVVMAGSLLSASGGLLDKGIHPTVIAQSFQEAGVYSAFEKVSACKRGRQEDSLLVAPENIIF